MTFKSMTMAGIRSILVGALMLCTASAQATMITFDFTGNGDNTFSTLSVVQMGVTLDITGRNLTAPAAATVTQDNADGLGVFVDPPPQSDGLELDSAGPNEALRFVIASLPVGITALRLEQVVFANLDIVAPGLEEFTLVVGDPAPGVLINFTPSTNPWDVSDDLMAAQRTSNSAFRFRVFGFNAATREAFTIKSITFSKVPEPAAFTLFGLGLAGFGFARYRKLA